MNSNPEKGSGSNFRDMVVGEQDGFTGPDHEHMGITPEYPAVTAVVGNVATREAGVTAPWSPEAGSFSGT
mgnify:CR=1 FL=1